MPIGLAARCRHTARTGLGAHRHSLSSQGTAEHEQLGCGRTSETICSAQAAKMPLLVAPTPLLTSWWPLQTGASPGRGGAPQQEGSYRRRSAYRSVAYRSGAYRSCKARRTRVQCLCMPGGGCAPAALPAPALTC